MTAPFYQTSYPSFVTDHFTSKALFVHDEAGGPDDSLLIQARVRSGDYFMTLATELDTLAQEYNNSGNLAVSELERLVAELMYVHKQFDVIRKSA